MMIDSRMRQVVAGFCLAVLAGSAYATEGALNLALPESGFNSQASASFVLAANDSAVLAANAGAKQAPVTPAAEFEPPLLSGSNAHQYLGLGTIVLAGLTAVTASEGCEGSTCPANAPRDRTGTHAKLAYATVGMAAATIASGLVTHWDDFSLEDGWSDPDNLHVLLGVAGAGLMAYAVQKAASQATGKVDHAGLAEAGALGMVVAIKLTW
ncbi:MAG: hypothetical protein EPO42_06190 [Gallionellaceae bacterium]|nr:MAG: hypothetical protein EPO42_06190 [Gallionellaceae bacterium]